MGAALKKRFPKKESEPKVTQSKSGQDGKQRKQRSRGQEKRFSWNELWFKIA
jgi:hypothetical protein